jgi:hypothetical protein
VVACSCGNAVLSDGDGDEWCRLQESHEFEILAGRDDPAWRGVSRFRLRMLGDLALTN